MITFAEVVLTLIALARGWRFWAILPGGVLMLWINATVESAPWMERQELAPPLLVGHMCALLVLVVMALKAPPRVPGTRETILRLMAGRSRK